MRTMKVFDDSDFGNTDAFEEGVLDAIMHINYGEGPPNDSYWGTSLDHLNEYLTPGEYYHDKGHENEIKAAQYLKDELLRMCPELPEKEEVLISICW